MAKTKHSRLQGAAALVLADGGDSPIQVIESSTQILAFLQSAETRALTEASEMGLFRILGLVRQGLEQAQPLLTERKTAESRAPGHGLTTGPRFRLSHPLPPYLRQPRMLHPWESGTSGRPMS